MCYKFFKIRKLKLIYLLIIFDFKLSKIPFFSKSHPRLDFCGAFSVSDVDNFSKTRNFKELKIETCLRTYEILLAYFEIFFKYNKRPENTQETFFFNFLETFIGYVNSVFGYVFGIENSIRITPPPPPPWSTE